MTSAVPGSDPGRTRGLTEWLSASRSHVAVIVTAAIFVSSVAFVLITKIDRDHASSQRSSAHDDLTTEQAQRYADQYELTQTMNRFTKYQQSAQAMLDNETVLHALDSQLLAISGQIRDTGLANSLEAFNERVSAYNALSDPRTGLINTLQPLRSTVAASP